MKKINNPARSNQDRIICVSISNKLTLYYQAVNSNQRKYLFETKSYSTIKYFEKKGHRLFDGSFYITVANLYRFHDYHNVKLTNIIERIPGFVDYVLNKESTIEQIIPAYCSVQIISNERSDEHVA